MVSSAWRRPQAAPAGQALGAVDVLVQRSGTELPPCTADKDRPRVGQAVNVRPGAAGKLLGVSVGHDLMGVTPKAKNQWDDIQLLLKTAHAKEAMSRRKREKLRADHTSDQGLLLTRGERVQERKSKQPSGGWAEDGCGPVSPRDGLRSEERVCERLRGPWGTWVVQHTPGLWGRPLVLGCQPGQHVTVRVLQPLCIRWLQTQKRHRRNTGPSPRGARGPGEAMSRVYTRGSSRGVRPAAQHKLLHVLETLRCFVTFHL